MKEMIYFFGKFRKTSENSVGSVTDAGYAGTVRETELGHFSSRMVRQVGS